jgi:hypothetical protein
MAIVVTFEFPGVTAAQYDGLTNTMTSGNGLRSLSDMPVKGLLSHVAGPTSDGWRVVDVWESEAAFSKFGEVLKPLLQEFKVPQAKPQIFPVHNYVKT